MTKHSSDELDVNSITKRNEQKKAQWHYIDLVHNIVCRCRQHHWRCTRTLKHKPKKLPFPSTTVLTVNSTWSVLKNPPKNLIPLPPPNPNPTQQNSLSHFNGTRQETSLCSTNAWRKGGSHLWNFLMPHGDKFKTFKGFIRGKEK